MILCSGLAAICGIWADEIAAMLGSHAATVNDDRHRFSSGTRPQSPNESAVDRVQRPVREPPSQPAVQGGAADESVGSGEHPPSHSFMDKVTEGLHDLHGFRPWMTGMNALGIDLINQVCEDVKSRRCDGLSLNDALCSAYNMASLWYFSSRSSSSRGRLAAAMNCENSA